MPQTGIVIDKRYLDHLTLNGHPENRRRLEVIHTLLNQDDMRGQFETIVPRFAEKDEICMVHSPEYYDQIAGTDGIELCSLTADTHTSPFSYQAALLAVGGLFEAISQVVAGKWAYAFAMVRPPGHHAEKNRAMGFCLFNNVALGAKFARETLGIRRVLIVDWDVHHGNGTQHAFQSDPTVLFFSTHQHPLFPGTGLFMETGIGKGEGYTMNIPLPKGYGEAEFAAIFEKLLRPVAMEFEPELILVSAGFDIHKADVMGGMNVTSEGFAVLTHSLMDISRDCNSKLVFCLEGGYHIKTIGDSVKAVLDELSGRTTCDLYPILQKANRKKTQFAVDRTTHIHRQFWKKLRD